jgi:glycosyltransferase involved in cell wall biosynthesis
MKILIFTQKVDSRDPVLSFFHRWLEEFAKRYEEVTVICLGKGEYSLPENVRVFSLGKEEKKNKLQYLINFYKYIWEERDHYDVVFVHMNQEYILLGWKVWFLLRKRIYLWRNHPIGSLWTKMAGLVSHKVFYTSPQSFTAEFDNGVQMPVGIDTEFFKPSEAKRIPGSVLFLGRIAPIKKVMEFVEWFKTSHDAGLVASATVAGRSPPKRYEVFQRGQRQGRGSQSKERNPVHWSS